MHIALARLRLDKTPVQTAPLLCLGEEDEVSIQEAVEMIAEALEFKGQIHYDTSLSDGQLKKTANNAKLRRYLPDFPFTPLREGTKLTCDWFVKNYQHSPA
ncbi:GDP-L-fucose synthase-like [Gadus macrocephalus]|uniref:GDP-L-fucose synthase-like n=1 Tax=Gadus macrocephalus TaxID=80720 RepID=UPI0028CB83BD|nr:GDP-L-fucose synthase-like [Gadus macrocephalus]